MNPGHRVIGDLPAYPTVDALPEPPDVAWIGLPAAQAADAILACGRARIPFAVVLGAGFAETGESGAVEQARLVESARRAGVRLLGPNTVSGSSTPGTGWRSPSRRSASSTPSRRVRWPCSRSRAGSAAVSSTARPTGASAWGCSSRPGNEADLSLADYLDWLVEDGRARAIACLVEQVRAADRVAAAVERAAARGIAVRRAEARCLADRLPRRALAHAAPSRAVASHGGPGRGRRASSR